MSDPQVDRPVAGLYPDEPTAERGADELRERGIQAEVKLGAPLAERRFGGHLGRGFVTGLLIALPFAILLPFAGWSYRHTGASPLQAIAWLSLPILFVGGFLGAMVAGARHQASQREKTRAVVTEGGLSPETGRQAAGTIDRTGGEVVDTPDRPHIAG